MDTGMKLMGTCSQDIGACPQEFLQEKQINNIFLVMAIHTSDIDWKEFLRWIVKSKQK